MFNKSFKQLALIILDIIAIQASFFMAFYLRFEKNLFTSPDLQEYYDIYIRIIFVIVFVKIFVMFIMKMYDTLWSYATITDFSQIVICTIISTTFFTAYMVLMQEKLPRSIFILTFIFDTVFFIGTRLMYRIYKNSTINIFRKSHVKDCRRVLIIGGGIAGSNIIRELKSNNDLNALPICVVDDDLGKQDKLINGVPILGTRKDICKLVESNYIDQIIIAMPSASKRDISEILNEVRNTNCEIKIIPNMNDLLDGTADLSKVRNVDISDLLGRDEVQLSTDEMKTYISNKVILVTGAGGSIGSELCRQIAKYSPEKIVLLDIYENNVFTLQYELKRAYPNLKTDIVIASVRDKKRVFDIVKKYRPFVIFHAAAHKHVPLMEGSPEEAVKNNIFGSYNVMEAAKEFKVARFVLISSDKAVRPTNVMGATKRIIEILVKSYNNCETTKFVAVRFGNVLCSNGSVIPIFKDQIAQGGPVTVTHRDITRYFMTIPEAARLVIQASSFGRNGEIFVLDMGEPIKIVDLAENLIRLSGLIPYEDIDILFTGLRPGEKMYEELILDSENCVKTVFEKIFIEKQDDILEKEEVDVILNDFKTAIDNSEDVRAVISKYVTTYKFY